MQSTKAKEKEKEPKPDAAEQQIDPAHLLAAVRHVKRALTALVPAEPEEKTAASILFRFAVELQALEEGLEKVVVEGVKGLRRFGIPVAEFVAATNRTMQTHGGNPNAMRALMVELGIQVIE